MKNTISTFPIAVAVSFLVIITGCKSHDSKDVNTSAPISVSSLIADGWSDYHAGDYQSALDNFSIAAANDATSLEAYLGIGWASIQVNQLDQARGNLNNVVALAPLPDLGLTTAMVETLTVEAITGLAQVDFITGDFQTTWNETQNILTRMPNFRFRHDTSVDWRRVTLLSADAALNMNRYSWALTQVTKLDSSLYNNTSLLPRVRRSLGVNLLDSSTVQNGRIRIDVPDPSLVYIVSIQDTTRTTGNNSTVTIPLDSLVEGGSSMFAIANPTPPSTFQYRVDYLRTDSYSTFIGMLRSLMQSLRNQ